MRRSVVVAAVLLALAFVLVGGPSLLLTPTTDEIAPEREPNPQPEIVRPVEGESGFWPYLNARRAFQKRSPVNVVVAGETDEVLRLLTESGEGDWEETHEELEEADSETHSLVVESVGNESAGNGSVGNESTANGSTGNGSNGNVNGSTGNGSVGDGPTGNESVVGNGSENESVANKSVADESIEVGSTEIRWGRTTGASRYAYVDPGDEEDGRWVQETAQVHDGTYYGHRYHIRMYESPDPDEPWVAMQTHSEHFDWFTLRHRVHGSHRAQVRLEADLMSLPQVDERRDVSRVYLGNRNAKDADGWATFVDVVGTVLAALVIGSSVTGGALGRVSRGIDDRLTERDRRRIDAARERVDPRHPVLAATVVAIVLGVRAGGIALEGTGALSMHAIAAVLYPFLGVGLPVGAYLIASGLERRLDAAVVAGGSLAAGIWLDYGTLGVRTLPVDVILQRMLAVVALGLIAGGAARKATRDSRLNDMLIVGVLLWAATLGGTLLGYL